MTADYADTVEHHYAAVDSASVVKLALDGPTIRQSVAQLNSSLAAERDRIRLDLAQVIVDARAWFNGEGARDGNGASVGDFLEGLDLPGEDGFEDWLRERRSALRDCASQVARYCS